MDVGQYSDGRDQGLDYFQQPSAVRSLMPLTADLSQTQPPDEGGELAYDEGKPSSARWPWPELL